MTKVGNMFQYQDINSIRKSYYKGFLTQDDEGNPCFPKFGKKRVTVERDGYKFTVTANLSTFVNRMWKGKYGTGAFGYAYYILGRRVMPGSPNSYEIMEGWPHVDPVDKTSLKKAQVQHRLLFFLKSCQTCMEKDVLNYIAMTFPQSPSGSLDISHTMHITTFFCIADNQTTELVAIPKTETELEIKLQNVEWNNGKVDALNHDVLTTTELFQNLSIVASE